MVGGDQEMLRFCSAGRLECLVVIHELEDALAAARQDALEARQGKAAASKARPPAAAVQAGSLCRFASYLIC